MDREIKSFIKIWLIAITSLLYCYYISSRLSKGFKRLISIVPILYLFITLPLELQSFHLGGPTVFFLVWLATFKLLLFSFDHPPLSPLPPNSPLRFVATACLPIKIAAARSSADPPEIAGNDTKSDADPSEIRRNRNETDPANDLRSRVASRPIKISPAKSSSDPSEIAGNKTKSSANPSEIAGNKTKSSANPSEVAGKKTKSSANPSEIIRNKTDPTRRSGPRAASWAIPTPIKVVALALIVKAYEYRPYMDSHVTLFLYCAHMYLGIELVLALCALPARTILGFEIEPQFNEPYLTTSLQDFWGRRWNLMVSTILKPSAYEPMRYLTAPLLGPQWAQLVSLVWAFAVSGLMHEAVYYYQTRAQPTWEVTGFFVLQGVCTAAEVAVKRRVGGRWRPPRVVSGGLVLGFLMVTGNWLFFPQLMRNGVHEKAIGEYAIMVDFLKKLVGQ